MIIKPDVLQRALNYAKKGVLKKNKVIILSANGKRFNQKLAKIIQNEELLIICGRYEGVDQRFIDSNSIEEISIGDYVLSGGEIPALILIDTCVRLIPEVLGNSNSLNSESFDNHLLEYPQYTKPYKWKTLKVPDILLSGNHKKISDWRLKKSIEKTKKERPDLFKLYLEKVEEIMNTLESYEKKQLESLSSGKSYPSFSAGDTLKVHLKVKEGEKERIQVFEGVCIAKKCRT